MICLEPEHIPPVLFIDFQARETCLFMILAVQKLKRVGFEINKYGVDTVYKQRVLSFLGPRTHLKCVQLTWFISHKKVAEICRESS